MIRALFLLRDSLKSNAIFDSISLTSGGGGDPFIAKLSDNTVE